MDDFFLVKMMNNDEETEYVTICTGNTELSNLISNLDEEKYVINDVTNLGCIVEDWTEFISRKGTDKIERGI